MFNIIKPRCLSIKLLFLVMLFWAIQAFAQTSEEALIKGFAEWQADRIERIVLDEAIRDISEDEYVKRFFTKTSQSVLLYENISSKRLIPLMSFYIKEDLDSFKKLGKCIKKSVDYYLTTSIPIAYRADTAEKGFENIKNLASKPNPKEGKVFTVQDFLSANCVAVLEAENLVDSSKLGPREIEERAYELAKHIRSEREKRKKSIATRKATTKALPDDLDDLLEKKQAILSFVTIVNEFHDKAKEDAPLVIKVHQFFQILEYFGISEDDYSGFLSLKSSGLFFASLADAADTKSSDAVVAVLEEFVNEKDVFNRKYKDTSYYSLFDVISTDEEGNLSKVKYSSVCSVYWILPCKDSIFLSSYYGLSYSYLKEEPGADKEGSFRAFGPVGVDLKLATFKSSVVSLSVSPIDIGNYVTNELKGGEYSAKFEDILAPSFFISIAAKSKPLALLIGYQKEIKLSESFETEGPFISVVFDLPIFTIY